MQADWLLPAVGTVIAFLVLSVTFWSVFEKYDALAAQREASAVAKEVTDKLAVVANSADEYSQFDFSEKILLPEEIHGVPYRLIIDDEKFQIRVELLGRYEGEVVGASRMPPGVVYNGEEKILELKGFESTHNGVYWTISEKMNGLRITKRIKAKRALIIEVVGNGS